MRTIGEGSLKETIKGKRKEAETGKPRRTPTTRIAINIKQTMYWQSERTNTNKGQAAAITNSDKSTQTSVTTTEAVMPKEVAGAIMVPRSQPINLDNQGHIIALFMENNIITEQTGVHSRSKSKPKKKRRKKQPKKQ